MSKKMAVHFSSKSDDWETPQWLFDKLHKKYNFILDVCAQHKNAKCVEYIAENSLENLLWNCPPGAAAWMNPPYGRKIGDWIQKAYETSLSGTTVVCLLPARTDTAWFHDYCKKGKIEFLRGRLKFGSCKNSAPFPSMIVVFKGQKP